MWVKYFTFLSPLRLDFNVLLHCLSRLLITNWLRRQEKMVAGRNFFTSHSSRKSHHFWILSSKSNYSLRLLCLPCSLTFSLTASSVSYVTWVICKHIFRPKKKSQLNYNCSSALQRLKNLFHNGILKHICEHSNVKETIGVREYYYCYNYDM